MSHVLDVSTSEETGVPWLLDFNVKCMFHLGFWYEDPDLNQDLHFFGPRLARFVVRHSKLRASLRLFRYYYPRWIVTHSAALCCCCCLPNLYYGWEEQRENALRFCVDGAGLATGAVTTLLFAAVKKQLMLFVIDLEKSTSTLKQDKESERKTIEKIASNCNKASKYTIVTFAIGLMLFQLSIMLMEFIPRRKLWNEAYLPYDTEAFPNYEITVIYMFIIITNAGVCCVILAPFPVFLMIILNTKLNILNKKIRNIRVVSMNLVEDKINLEMSGIKLYANLAQEFMSAGDPDVLQLVDVTEDEFELVGCACPGEGGAARLEGDCQEMAADSVEGENTTGLDSHDEQEEEEEEEEGETVGSFDPAVDQEMQTQLARNVDEHNTLLSLTQTLTSLNDKWMVFFNTVVASILAGMIWMTIHNNQLARTIFYGLIFTEVALIQLLYCYIADNISHQSALVGQSCYECDWLMASKSFKKKMLIVMTRANVPVKIKPSGLDALSLKLFGEIINNAYKLLTTIQSFGK